MLNMAILGCGRIAAIMAQTIGGMKGEVNAYAVAARDGARAREFAERYHFEKSFGSYEEMLRDPEVDLVYIAVPHSLHALWAGACLHAGKHVLCEKSFTVNEAEARQVLELAEKKKLLCTEASWPRYMPSRKMISELIESGIIGKVQTVFASLDYNITDKERMVRPELAGGALLDVGVYTLNFASMVCGDRIRRIAANCVKYETGVDEKDNIFIEYEDGRMATLYAGMTDCSNRMGVIGGTDGFIEVDNINNPQEISVFVQEGNGKRLVKSVRVPEQITGYEYEVRSAIRAIEEGRLECEEMPHAQTLELMRQMDECRRQFGLVYPFEQ